MLLPPGEQVVFKNVMESLSLQFYSCSHFFPNRSLLLKGSHGDSKRGVPETHTKRTAVRAVARPGIATAVLKKAFSLQFFEKAT